MPFNAQTSLSPGISLTLLTFQAGSLPQPMKEPSHPFNLGEMGPQKGTALSRQGIKSKGLESNSQPRF